MTSATEARFYVVRVGDKQGKTARGPYTESEAASLRESDEMVISETRLRRMQNPQPMIAASSQEKEDPREAQARMVKEIKGWGRGLMLLGAIHLVANGFLSGSWGVLLLLVGLGSFCFRAASLFVVYAVTLAWAATANAVSGDVRWLLFGAFQVYLAVRVLLRYRIYRRSEARLVEQASTTGAEPAGSTGRAPRLFPWAGCALSALGMVGVIATIALSLVLVFADADLTQTDMLGFVYGLAVNLGVLGFSMGLGSLLSRYRPWPVSAGAVVFGALTMIEDLAFRLMSS